jgi:serine/threonine protein kinase
MVHDDGPLEDDLAADYIRQAADGLEHAHIAGLIHRDIKPANLLVDQKGVVKVLDMGLARWEQDDKTASLTIAHEENVLGTADYLPPEQAKDSHTVDKRADIYSLGCTLYFVLTGHAPFPEGTLPQRIQKHINQMPKSVYEDRPDAPPPLVDVCLRMMAKEPDARYQSAGEVSQVLGKWLEMRGKGSADGGAAARAPSALRRSGSPPKPPRRGTATDDTVSNFNRETLAGAPDPNKSKAGMSGSQIRTGSSILTREGSGVMGRGSGIVGRSGSHILGDPTLSTKSSVKGLGKSLPTAKPLTPAAEPPKDEPKGETLNALIEDALRERESQIPPGKRTPQIAGTQSGAMRSYQPAPEPALPKWFWYVLAGGIAAVAAIVGLVVWLGGH